ncbi:MAG TPA: heavy metal-responsive transcriptional regulator [Alphaproteobacteria bacterium]|nr:heavy metal-responsive transcriptional regulator [Alphaproteobacteria bacterium]
MEIAYTIGQLARAAGVPTSTVRYYERIGLLHADGRTAGNYRLYGREALARLRFIRAAQATGFTLEDVTTILQLRDATPNLCQEVQDLIEERLADLERRMADLRHVQRVLKAVLKRCHETQWEGHCHIVEKLTATSASPL